MIKIFGVQRTGTNYLSALIERNLGVEVFNNDFGWKHGDIVWPKHYLSSEKVSMERRDALAPLLGKNLFCIIIIKNPYTWLQSIESWAKRAWPKPMTVEGYFEFYNTRYKHYMEVINSRKRLGYKKIFYVQYESLLSDLIGTIRKIAELCNIPCEEVEDVSGVPMNRGFNEERRMFYLNPVYDEKIAKCVDWETMCFYGYYENVDELYKEDL